MELKVLIIDDDEGMRLVLRKIITKTEGFKLVGEAENGEIGFSLAETLSPHIVFLDVEMPGMNGVMCAKKIIDIAPKTFIIFATAHEKYMSEAFEVYASDYLIKPFKIDRVLTTLERIKEVFTNKDTTSLKHSLSSNDSLSKLVITPRFKMKFIDCRKISLHQRRFIEAGDILTA